jgi:ferredoxin/flavodoxin---NADP+ reductase
MVENADEEADIEADILIVGAGPTGLYGAYYAGFRGMRAAVMDILPEPGGQIMAMYPEKEIMDIAGYPSVRGRNLVSNLIQQTAPYEPRYLLGHEATRLGFDSRGLPTVTSHLGVTVHAKAVVITGGIGTFTPRRLTMAGEYEGRGLSYFVTSPAEHAERDVVIVGGGDSAFDWALTLEPLARSVTLVHRRDSFRAHAATVGKVRASRAEIIVNAEVTAVHGTKAVTAVEVKERRDGSRRTLPAQSLIAALGFVADPGPLLEWGVDMSARHVSVDTRMATNLPRIFAAGDIVDYPGKVRLIATGFGEVATAVNNAATVIDPQLELFPGHSTERES